MAKTKYVIALSNEQRQLLEKIIAEGKESDRTIMRARILLLSDITMNEKLSVPKVAELLGTTHTTVQTVRAEYGKEGLEAAVFRKKRTDNIETRRINSGVRKQILELSNENRLIGQKELVKTAICIEISIHMAVISFLKEDIGWTKRVGKDADMC